MSWIVYPKIIALGYIRSISSPSLTGYYCNFTGKVLMRFCYRVKSASPTAYHFVVANRYLSLSS